MTTKIGRTNALKPQTITVVWTRAAGRCQYPGCNRDLLNDFISGNYNRKLGFVAHIVADDPNGPRGSESRSRLLSNDPANLMLLCHTHHRLIDVDDVAGHPESLLLEMKAAHERRMAIVAAIQEERASHVLRFTANIGEHNPSIPFDQMAGALLPDRYPIDGPQTLNIELRGSSIRDREASFWQFERENLRRQFASKVVPLTEKGELRHLSVFGIAPQPLLIDLGILIGDLVPTDVFQRHRDTDSWRWPTSGTAVQFEVRRPEPGPGQVALVIAVSATVTDDRIQAVLGPDTRIWRIDAVAPHNDIIKRREDLSVFRNLVRRTMDDIKAQHGEAALLNVFPAMPVSAAIEFGRVRMPKADIALQLWDENKEIGGFRPAFRIDNALTAALAA